MIYILLVFFPFVAPFLWTYLLIKTLSNFGVNKNIRWLILSLSSFLPFLIFYFYLLVISFRDFFGDDLHDVLDYFSFGFVIFIFVGLIVMVIVNLIYWVVKRLKKGVFTDSSLRSE